MNIMSGLLEDIDGSALRYGLLSFARILLHLVSVKNLKVRFL